MNAIETRDLTKKYPGQIAVDRLNLEIQRGELFSLLGVNGAGKSTAIRMLCCLTNPTSGDALLMGMSVRDNPQAVKREINLSPQETAVAPNLTVRENLQLISGIHGERPPAARAQAGEMIERLRMEEIAQKRARTLSGGWQRRLSIAMALISKPKILFLDEPTLGLDVLARRELWRLVEELKGRVTILLTTHYLEEAEALSDRIGVLVKGRLKAVGTARELTQRTGMARLEDAFVALAEGGNAK